MAITHIGTSLRASQGHTDTVTLNKPAGTERNDLMLMAVNATANPQIATPSGWTLWIAGLQNLRYYYKFAVDGEPSSWTWQWDSTYANVAGVAVFRGVSKEHGRSVGQNYDSTPPSAPYTSVFGTINANGRQSLYVIVQAARVNFGNVSFPWPAGSGYTSLFNDDNDPVDATGGWRLAMAYKISSGASEVPAGVSMTSDSLPATVTWNTAYSYFIAKNSRQSIY